MNSGSSPAPRSPACCWRTRSPSAWMVGVLGATTSLSSGSGARSNMRRCICEPTTASPRHAPRSAGIWSFTTANARIRALPPEHRITPISTICRSLRQREFRLRCWGVTPVGLRPSSSRHGELLPRASHRTVRADHAYGSLDQSIRTPAPAGLIPAVCEGLATRL